MAEINVSKLSKSMENQPVLQDVSFLINAGDKVGIVGANGAGKTTLLRLLCGDLEADAGQVNLKNDLKIGYLEQVPSLNSSQSVYEECKKGYYRAFKIEKELRDLEKEMGELADDKESLGKIMDRYLFLTDRFEEEGGHSYDSEIKGILKGLGFQEDQLDQEAQSLSGGEKARLELARLLCGRPDILFLDEPTNHLDIKGIQFLESFLQDFRGTVLAISHDRYFLDQISNRTFLIEGGKLISYDCGYEEFTHRRARDLEVQAHAYKTQQEKIAYHQEIIDRLSHLGGSKRKRGISQAKSRQKLLDKMEKIDPPQVEEDQMNLVFSPRYPSGEDVLKILNLSKSFDDQVLFQGVSAEIHRGEKVGLIGDNGVGKTTLFRIILGQEDPDEGRIYPGTAVKTAYYDQEQSNLDPDKRLVDEIWDDHPRFTYFMVRSALAKFAFKGDEVEKTVAELSGGERSRLALLKLMLMKANFLLLDEPTNHLDLASREVLEDALNSYEGTVLAISHDRYFLNHVCDRIFVLTAEGLSSYLGNYDDYLASLEKEKEGIQGHDQEGKTQTQIKKEERHSRQKKRNLQDLKRQVKNLESKISRLEEDKKELNQEAYRPEITKDYKKALAHQEKIDKVDKEIQDLTEQWMELGMELEDKQ